jgi:DNA repair protein RadC
MFVSELRRRKYRGREEVVIRGPEDLFKLLRPKIGKEDREHFVAVLLSSRNTVIGIETISIGSLNASIVHPREVFKPAIIHSASAIALGHNHPSGDPTPSEEDIAITKRIKEAGMLIGIEVVDHVVVAGTTYVSLREKRLC